MSLVVGSELDGFVSHVESDAGAQFLKVWIQFDSHLPALIESTLASMKEILNDDAGLIQPQDLKVGDMYLARYVEDNNWYRARIVDISSLSKGSVLVSFVDYGNCESVDVGVIRKVNNDIANHRDQAHMCLLGDVFPVDVSWSVNVLKYCKENLCYEEVLVKITSIINSLPVVRITVRTKQISFNEEIILAGYARSSSSVLNNGVKEGSQAVSKLEKGSRSDSCNYVSRNLPSQQTTVEIYIMHVISATKIWVHFVKDRELHNWDAMKTGIESYYQNVPQKPFEKVTVGMMCIAQSLEKNCFARGLITEKDTKACHVLFMDYGNIEQKLASNLYALPTAYKAVPSLAQQCLVDVSAWSGDPRHIREHLRSLEGSTPVKCYILGKTKNLYHIQLITDYGNSKEFGVPPTYQRVVVEPGQTYAVEVTHIRRPTSFYVQKLDSRPAYQMLFAELQNENKIRSNPLNASSLYPGMPCCVFSNDHWYRGEIVQAPVPGVVSVFFVDIGQKDVVTIGNVTTISPDLIQRLPAQAIECCLQGFESGGQKSKAGVKEMTAMISQRQVTLEVMDVRNDVARVNMYDSHKGGFRLLNLELSVRIEDSQKKIVVPFPEIGDIETIFVTFFESLSNFFGQCVKFSTESLDQLQQQLNLYYGGMNSGECILYADGQSHIGDYCCAPYSLDHQFYRGKVLKKQAEEVTVLFVDFGNKEVVPACDVKILSSRFTHHPQFGVWCCYEDSGSVNMTPQILSGILLNQTVTLEVVRRGENVLHVKISPLHNEPELVKKLTFLNNVGASQEQSLSLPFLQYIDLPLTGICINEFKTGIKEKLFYSYVICLGDEEEITIVHFKNPLKFWCQLNRLTQDVALVTSLVSDYVQNSSCLVMLATVSFEMSSRTPT